MLCVQIGPSQAILCYSFTWENILVLVTNVSSHFSPNENYKMPSWETSLLCFPQVHCIASDVSIRRQHQGHGSMTLGHSDPACSSNLSESQKVRQYSEQALEFKFHELGTHSRLKVAYFCLPVQNFFNRPFFSKT